MLSWACAGALPARCLAVCAEADAAVVNLADGSARGRAGVPPAPGLCRPLALAADPAWTAPLPGWRAAQRVAARAAGVRRVGDAWVESGGGRVFVKVPRRAHERSEDVGRSPVEVPVLARGVTELSWWVLLPWVGDGAPVRPDRPSLVALGRLLRRWHVETPGVGVRLDDPRGLGLFLGTMLRSDPLAFARWGSRLSDACQGLPMVAVHGDLAHDHNVLWRRTGGPAVIDPGAVALAPAALDVAFAVSRAWQAGAPRPALEWLLSGYGAAVPGLAAVVPVLVERSRVDARVLRAASSW